MQPAPPPRRRLAPCLAGAALAVLAPLLPSRGHAGADDAPAPAAPRRSAPARDAWLEHGFPAQARADLRAWLAAALARQDVAGGALRIDHRGETILREGFGHADRKTSRAFTPETPCRIASISKPMVAALLLRLAEAQRLDLEAPLERVLPEFAAVAQRDGAPVPRTPRVRELLSHTAGFVADEEPGGRPWLAERPAGWTLADQARRVAKEGFVRAPGTRFAYSGTGYDVAGRVAEVAAGLAFERAFEEHLARPLGLEHTTYLPSAQVRDALPTYYYLWESDGRLRADLTPRPVPAAGLYRSVGGGVLSTLDDVARFFALLAQDGLLDGRRLLTAEHARAMRTAQAPATRYGLGLSLGPGRGGADGVFATYQHSGSTGTLAFVDGPRELLVVILTQGHRVKGGAVRAPARTLDPDAPSFCYALRAEIERLLPAPAAAPRRG